MKKESSNRVINFFLALLGLGLIFLIVLEFVEMFNILNEIKNLKDLINNIEGSAQDYKELLSNYNLSFAKLIIRLIVEISGCFLALLSAKY